MARYINADLIKEKLQRTIINGQTAFINNVLIGLLDKAPTEDVQEVKHGEWKECFEDWRKQIAGDECSSCGFQHYGSSIVHYHYCPNCGAKMDGDAK